MALLSTTAAPPIRHRGCRQSGRTNHYSNSKRRLPLLLGGLYFSGTRRILKMRALDFRLQRLSKRYEHKMSEGPTALPPQNLQAVSILDSYCRLTPTDQNAVDIFQGEWSSQFPPPFDYLKAGQLAIFQDVRLAWAIKAMGGVGNQTVLELGPLEGGHAYMLEHAGAAFISAIEANSRAYLKCLISKEILQLERTRFWFGNFIPYLETTDQRFDLIVASGVLYHMQDPLRLLQLIAAHTNRIYMWTHYYDEQIVAANPNLNPRFLGRESIEVGGQTITLHQQFYKAALKDKAYCGGSEISSKWFTREGLMTVLKDVGFREMDFAFESPDHPNGPSLSLIATK